MDDPGAGAAPHPGPTADAVPARAGAQRTADPGSGAVEGGHVAAGDRGRVRVRPAVPDDAAALYRLSLRAIRGSAAELYTGAQLEAWVARRSVDGHRRLVTETRTSVAVLDGAVVGFASLAGTPEPTEAVVDQLFVDPAAGGRGVARLLLTGLDDAARAAGVRRLVTHASWRAVPVFRRLGYRQVEVETVHLGDQTLTRALMHRDLGTG